MNVRFLDLAQKKWFVPLLLLLIFGIAVSSLLGEKKSAATVSQTEEERLAALCNSVSGVADAQIMITYEAVYAVSVLGRENEGRKISGIAVVCRGGDDPAVQLTLYGMLESLYALPSTRISVSGSK